MPNASYGLLPHATHATNYPTSFASQRCHSADAVTQRESHVRRSFNELDECKRLRPITPQRPHQFNRLIFYAFLFQLVLECNEAARESQDAEETAAIVDKIEFPRYLKNTVTLGQFVMKNDFMKNPLEGMNQGGGGSQLNWTFRKSKRTLHWLILFSNQLLVTKKKR